MAQREMSARIRVLERVFLVVLVFWLVHGIELAFRGHGAPENHVDARAQTMFHVIF